MPTQKLEVTIYWWNSPLFHHKSTIIFNALPPKTHSVRFECILSTARGYRANSQQNRIWHIDVAKPLDQLPPGLNSRELTQIARAIKLALEPLLGDGIMARTHSVEVLDIESQLF